MFRAIIALIFSVCLTGASTAHLATANAAQSIAVQNVQQSLVHPSTCVHSKCSPIEVKTSKSHSRCQVDVAPICVSDKMAAQEEYILRSPQLTSALQQTVRTPEPKPPQPV